MDILIGFLSLVVTVGLPIYLHQKNHPRRELRFAMLLLPTDSSSRSSTQTRLLAWSSGRADIPSSYFDSATPIIFRFDSPLTPATTGHNPLLPTYLSHRRVNEIHLAPQVIHDDFVAEFVFTTDVLPRFVVLNPLIDVKVVRDERMEKLPPAQQVGALARSRARARLSLFRGSSWLFVISSAMFIIGVSISGLDPDLGLSIGGPGLFLLPVSLIMLAVAGVRALVMRMKTNVDATPPTE